MINNNNNDDDVIMSFKKSTRKYDQVEIQGKGAHNLFLKKPVHPKCDPISNRNNSESE